MRVLEEIGAGPIIALFVEAVIAVLLQLAPGVLPPPLTHGLFTAASLALMVTAWYIAAQVYRRWNCAAVLAATLTVTIISGLFVWYGAKAVQKDFWPQPVAPPAPVKPLLEPLSYRICGMYIHNPHDVKLRSLEIEIDLINPNHQDVNFHIKRWSADFGGRPGTTDVDQRDGVLAPQEKIIEGVTSQPASRLGFVFDPPIKAAPIITGSYNFELRYGWDEDNETTPAQLSGTITGTFDSDGLPTAKPVFSPTGGRNVSFDPGECKVDLIWRAATPKTASTAS